MRRARAAGVVLLLAVSLVAPGIAQATEVSATELHALAQQAGDSSQALEDLRAVTSVTAPTNSTPPDASVTACAVAWTCLTAPSGINNRYS